jgi:uncharacterized membrane protein YkoI
MRLGMVLCLLAAAVLAVASCSKPGDAPRRLEAGEAVPFDRVPAAAKVTIQRETLGTRLAGIHLLRDEAKTLYVVEAEAGGKTLWLQVAPDGKLVDKAEAEDLKVDQLPVAVQAAVERELKDGKIEGLRLATRGRRSYYEVELLVGGKEVDLTINANGKVMERVAVDPK